MISLWSVYYVHTKNRSIFDNANTQSKISTFYIFTILTENLFKFIEHFLTYYFIYVLYGVINMRPLSNDLYLISNLLHHIYLHCANRHGMWSMRIKFRAQWKFKQYFCQNTVISLLLSLSCCYSITSYFHPFPG